MRSFAEKLQGATSIGAYNTSTSLAFFLNSFFLKIRIYNDFFLGWKIGIKKQFPARIAKQGESL